MNNSLSYGYLLSFLTEITENIIRKDKRKHRINSSSSGKNILYDLSREEGVYYADLLICSKYFKTNNPILDKDSYHHQKEGKLYRLLMMIEDTNIRIELYLDFTDHEPYFRTVTSLRTLRADMGRKNYRQLMTYLNLITLPSVDLMDGLIDYSN